MEILKNFGFDPVLLGAQIVNFTIILFLLKKFLYKPVLDILKQRENTIRQGLENAEEGHKTLEKALEQEKSILKQAKNEAQKYIEEAKTQSQVMIKDAQEESRKQTEKMISDAKEQIAQEVKRAEGELSKNAGRLAIELLQKSLDHLFSEKTQSEVMEKAIKYIKKQSN